MLNKCDQSIDLVADMKSEGVALKGACTAKLGFDVLVNEFVVRRQKAHTCVMFGDHNWHTLDQCDFDYVAGNILAIPTYLGRSRTQQKLDSKSKT